MSLVPHLPPPATTDEERASRARWNNLRRRFRGEELGPLTEAEDIEFTELSIRYNFVGGPAIKAWRDLKEKERAEQEERSRLGQLERQKKAAAAARSRSAAELQPLAELAGNRLGIGFGRPSGREKLLLLMLLLLLLLLLLLG